jgi:hypothetical protein
MSGESVVIHPNLFYVENLMYCSPSTAKPRMPAESLISRNGGYVRSASRPNTSLIKDQCKVCTVKWAMYSP